MLCVKVTQQFLQRKGLKYFTKNQNKNPNNYSWMYAMLSDWDVQITALSNLAHPNSRRGVSLVCDTSLRSVMRVLLSLSTKTKGYFSAINTKPEDDRARAKTSAYLCWYHRYYNYTMYVDMG